MRDDNVAHSTFYLLIGMGVGLALNFILGCVNMLLLVGGAVFAMKDFNAARHALGGTGVIVLVLSMVIVFIWVLLFIWYMIVLFQFRGALSARLESNS